MKKVLSGTRETTEAQIEAESRALAGWLHAQGLRENDIVALLMWNDFPFLSLPRATALIGAYLVPLNWHLTRAELDYILADCNAKVLIGHDGLLWSAGLETRKGFTVLAKPTPPEVAAAYPKQTPAGQGNWQDWDSELARAIPFEGAARPGNRGGVFYTSGTTGKPKGVVRAPLADDIVAGIRGRTLAGFGLENVTEGDVALAPGPLYHSAPNAHALNAFAKGADIVLLPRFDAKETLQAMTRHKVSHAHMVPTMFSRLLALPEDERTGFDSASLKAVCHGAAPCPSAIKRAMLEWLGPVVREYYAGTETGVIATISGAQWLTHPGSVGQAVDGCVLKVIDAEGKELPANRTGALICRSDSTMNFHYHGRDGSPEVPGWPGYVGLGDIGHLDDEGYLFLTDRSADIVITGGVNIYPAEIEAELSVLPGVADCAVIGVPHPELGEAAIALVETRSGASMVEADLRSALAVRLASFKLPSRILFVTSLPREDSGKIRKRLLRDLHSDILTPKAKS